MHADSIRVLLHHKSVRTPALEAVHQFQPSSTVCYVSSYHDSGWVSESILADREKKPKDSCPRHAFAGYPLV